MRENFSPCKSRISCAECNSPASCPLTCRRQLSNASLVLSCLLNREARLSETQEMRLRHLWREKKKRARKCATASACGLRLSFPRTSDRSPSCATALVPHGSSLSGAKIGRKTVSGGKAPPPLGPAALQRAGRFMQPKIVAWRSPAVLLRNPSCKQWSDTE